jgi:hypothetical protein
VSGAQGDTTSNDVLAALDMDYEDEQRRWAFDAAYRRSAADGETTKHDAPAQLRRDWLLTDSRWFFFAMGRFDYDQFRTWTYRLNGAGGVGYQLWKGERFELQGLFGPSLSKEFQEDDFFVEALVGLEAIWKIAPDHSIKLSNTIYPALNDPGGVPQPLLARLEVEAHGGPGALAHRRRRQRVPERRRPQPGQERRQEDPQRDDTEGDHRHAQRGDGNAVVENLVGPARGEHGRDPEQHRAEGDRQALQESQAPRAVGMGWGQREVEAREAQAEHEEEDHAPEPGQHQHREDGARHRGEPERAEAEGFAGRVAGPDELMGRGGARREHDPCQHETPDHDPRQGGSAQPRDAAQHLPKGPAIGIRDETGVHEVGDEPGADGVPDRLCDHE